MLRVDQPKQSSLIWDDLGLSNPYSGVGVYSRKLYQALTSTGWIPRSFRGDIDSEEAMLKAKDSKLLLPQLRLLMAPAQSMIHGLSNINGPIIKFRSDIRTVTTIHDLIPLLIPPSSRYSWLFRAVIMRVATRSDAIVTVSHWTKRQLVERGVSPDKIHVILNGFPDWEPQSRQRRSYLLCISRYEDYKKIEFFVDLSAHLKIKAVLVTDAIGANRIGRKYESLCQKGQLEIKKGLSNAELHEVYEQSLAYIHPSEFEGFCLPAAEANARGVPVIYKKGSGIEETVKFGLGLEEYDLGEWGKAVSEFIDKSPENSLKDMVKLQSWAVSAQKLAQIYDQLNEGMS